MQQVIVVCDDEVPDMIMNMLPGTLFVRGNSDNSALMKELSLQNAYRVILLSCESHPSMSPCIAQLSNTPSAVRLGKSAIPHCEPAVLAPSENA